VWKFPAPILLHERAFVFLDGAGGQGLTVTTGEVRSSRYHWQVG
jgi:hypothetical protein